MSELTKRLRDIAAELDAMRCPHEGPRTDATMCIEAADRIDKLEECLRRLVAWHGSVRRPILTLDIITDEARALLEDK